ncbi:50S ribosomal protein L5 [bacterium]|nr:MAG: 50S ribosomal protein L5 [bacterium]
MSHSEKIFKKEIVPALQKDLKIANPQAVPCLQKIVLNTGVGKIVSQESKFLERIVGDMALIGGQKPIVVKARQAISGFKLREGAPVGVKITLRGKRMYDFTERLVKVILPRMRNFQGLSLKSIDQNHNLTIGLKDVTAFPELSHQKKIEYNFGLEITFVTKAKTGNEALLLLKKLGLIFKENN